MITRLTITAVVAVSVGWICPPLAAQDGTPDAAAPADYADCAAGCEAVAGCASLVPENYVVPENYLLGRRGHRHHPACQCPLCRPRPSWASFDALLWWGMGRTMPTLLTTSPQGTAPGNAGVLGQPRTAILFGNGGVGHDVAGGARADFGFWFDEYETLGLGAKVWGIDGDKQGLFIPSPDSNPILARPFYNLLLDQQDSLLISYPGLLRGSAVINTDSTAFGTEAYLRTNMLCGRGYHLDLIGGYHFVRLDDEVDIFTHSVVTETDGAVPVGTTIDVADSFDAKNEFHGGQLGVVGEARQGCWTLTGLAKLSVGNMRQRVQINGSTAAANPGLPPTVTSGGLLALPTNIGQYARDELALIPEINITLAYRVREWLHLTMGYNAIYWSNVVLSGDQIDTVVNTSQLSGGNLIGPPAPVFDFRDTEYWMHGFNFGATLTY